MNFRIIFSFFSLLSLPGCADQARIRDSSQVTLLGVYLEEFERHEFLGCDGKRYIVVNPEKLRILSKEAENRKKPIEAVVRFDNADSIARINGYDGMAVVSDARVSDSSTPCEAVQS